MEGSARKRTDTVTTAVGEEFCPEREHWANGTDYLFSLITLTVGLGNIWKFPYMTYDYGGAAFLIPYLLIHLVIGKPMYYLEMAIGQFVSRGPVKVWAVSPALQGVGYGQMLISSMILLYYGSLLALTGFYLIQSFTIELPWSRCFEDWGDTCYDLDRTSNESGFNESLRLPSEMFLYKYILNEPESIEDGIGTPDWRLTIGLAVFWVIIFTVVIRGVRSEGKAAYFFVIFPYVVLIGILIRGATLPGAGNGIYELFSPRWEELLNFKVWSGAMIATFYSLNIFFGTLIAFSSYNAFKYNVYRDSMIVTTLDTITSVLSACIVYCILGNLMYELNTDDINIIVRGGPGLVFVIYAEAIAKFDAVPQFFSVVFYLMLYVLGVGSAVALLILVITVIRDNFPDSNYLAVAVVTCTLGFVGGLVFVTPGGLFVFTLVNQLGVTLPVFVIGTFEIAGLAWIYGVNNICDDLEFMLGLKTGLLCRISWLVTPLLMIVVSVYSFVTLEIEEHNNHPFPTSAYVAGWFLFGIIMAQIPIWTLIVMNEKIGGSFLETIRASFRSSELWRPENYQHYKDWKDFKEKRRLERLGESLWQKIVRTLTGHSSGSSAIVESNIISEKF